MRIVTSISAAVHVKAVAVGVFQNQIVTSLIAGAGPASACNVVAAPVEQIGFDKGVGLVQHHAVAQAIALVVVEIVVMDVVVRRASPQEDRGVAPAPEFAVIDFEIGIFGLDGARVGDAVVAPFCVELSHLLGAPEGVRSLESKAGDADVGSGGDKERYGFELFGVEQGTLGAGFAPAAGERDAPAYGDVLVSGQVDSDGIYYIDYLVGTGELEGVEQFHAVCDEVFGWVKQAVITLATAYGIAGGVDVGTKFVI